MTKEETETYDEFTDLLEILGNFFQTDDEKDVVNWLYKITTDKKSELIVPKEQREKIKWCCWRFTSLRRKQINAEKNAS